MKKIIIALILILLVGCQSETENKAVKNDNSILYVGGERVVEGEGSYDIGDLSSSQFYMILEANIIGVSLSHLSIVPMKII